MPEGHTLHRLARDLTAAFAGSPVRVSSPQGRFADSAALLDGEVLLGAEAWGKQLFVEFPGERFVHVHLGLIGKFDVHAGVDEVPPPGGPGAAPAGRHAGRVRRPARRHGLRALDGGAARRRRRAVRVPTRCAPTPTPTWPGSGSVAAAHRSVALLMDQGVLAGVGNVYRAELLFRHRLHPLRPGRTLRVGQWRAMWDDLVVLMTEGVRTGRIDTVRPEHTPEAMGRPPRRDDHGGEVYVYRRTGQPCLVCGTSGRAPRCSRAGTCSGARGASPCSARARPADGRDRRSPASR